jgi:gamma-glutamyltranspeptidase/glutathione hydrolase
VRPRDFAPLLLVACAAPAPRAAPSSPPAPCLAAALPSPPASPPCDGDLFGLAPGADALARANIARRRGTLATATREMVAASNEAATQAGLAALRAGGNAADAYVAATLVDDVVFPGVTSLAGVAGVLVYDARTRAVTYVHGGLADPLDAARRFRRGDTESGRLVLVPGAPAAYAEVVRRFGKKSLAAAVLPAATLASDGFSIDALYAGSIARNRAKLEASAFGRATFFREGRTLREGETLKLGAMGKTLRAFGDDPRWFYRGPWATEAVRTANEHGGTLDARDFAAYAAEVGPAMHGRFLGHDVYAGGFGGATLLASLEALEVLRAGAPARAPSESADDLERLLRVAGAVRGAGVRSTMASRGLVTEAPGAVEALITDAVRRIVEEARAAGTAPSPSITAGSHSSAVIVVDAEGNVVVGTHSIGTLNWGEGLFVGGVPLSTAADTALDEPASATIAERGDALTDTLVLDGGAPRDALAVYGTGLFPADVQVLDAALARGLDAEQAVLEPRVGNVAVDLEQKTFDATKRAADPRYDAALACELHKRGFTLERSMAHAPKGFVDTGFPTLVTIAPGKLQGMTPDAAHVHGVAAGD